MSLVHNEQVKLGATAMNTSAVGLAVAGLFTPLSGSLNNPAGYNADILFYLRMFMWFLSALGLHFVARLTLESLRD